MSGFCQPEAPNRAGVVDLFETFGGGLRTGAQDAILSR